jgi:hypothetical protein
LDTLKTLRDQVLYWLDEANDSGSTKKNVDYALNQAHQQRCLQFPWKFMLLGPVTLTLVPNQRVYSLHQEFDKPLYFRNTLTGEYLREVPIRSLGPSGLDWNSDKEGDTYTLWGRSPVENQPSAASVLTIVSTGSDAGSTKAIIVRGETADGVTTETINPNGTTPVAGLVQFTRILQVTKISVWSGTLTMTSNAGSVTNLKLFPAELGRSYQQLQLLWIPQRADTIEYRFYRKPSPLTNDNDIPDIPHPHTQILVWDALKLLLGYDAQLDSARMRLIDENQARAEQALRESEFDGGNSMNAVTRRTYLDPEDIY